MKKILETERLVLREFELTDAQKMWELNSDTEVIKYTGDPPFVSVEEAEQFLAGYRDYAKNGFGRWAVLLKPELEFIGWCGLKYNEENLVDLGFRFFRRYRNRGFATESAGASLEYGFNTLSLDEIIARVSQKNEASTRVLQKLNMRFREKSPCEGISDALYYRIDKETFIKSNYLE